MFQDIKNFCRYFYATTYIPISHFHGEGMFVTLVESYPAKLQQDNPTSSALESIIVFHRSVDYFITKSSAMFGLVNLGRADDFIIVGPVFSTPITDRIIHEFMKECELGPSARPGITLLLSNTPQVSFMQFLHILAFLQLSLNQENIDIAEYFHLPDNANSQEVPFWQTELAYVGKENEFKHNTALFEQQMYHYMIEGDRHKLDAFLSEYATGLSAGIVADNDLRQAKNILIGQAAVCARYAMSGGMDAEKAYTLADIYTLKCERLADIPSIHQLQYNMLMDFTEQMGKSKLPQGISSEIHQCLQFISQHTNENIGVDDLADHIHRSRSYVSRKFKEEMGFNLNTFIMRCKLEEAKSLLTYTNKSLSEISSYLCFANQSYFQRVFKKKYGITPNEYRKQSSMNTSLNISQAKLFEPKDEQA